MAKAGKKPSSTNNLSDSQSAYKPNNFVKNQDDEGSSNKVVTSDFTISAANGNNSYATDTLRETDLLKSAYHASNLFTRNEIKDALYSKTYRFGLLNPYGAISTSREYLFFTKPDLHILNMDDYGCLADTNLNEALVNIPYWKQLWNTRMNTIKALQLSANPSDPFNHLLQNQVSSNLEIPGLSAETIDTPTNMYGVGYSYRGSSEASDDNPEFSLEFKDTRYLDTYMFFKTYEEYETLKHHGVIAPSQYYILNKILHDQFSIYKFIVDEDMETIIYYGKMYGVMPKSLPRDVFSNPNFDTGLSYSIDFKAAFYEEMRPDILSDFNRLSTPLYNAQKYQLSPFNEILDHADTRPGVAACVEKIESKYSPYGFDYKLRWRGSDKL